MTCRECDQEVEALGLCQRHYFRLRRTGTTKPRDNRPTIDKLTMQFGVGGASEADIWIAYSNRVQVVGPMDCWAIGDPERKRYPMARTQSGPKTLHRAIFKLVHGEPELDLVRHRCDRPACIRPTHLEEGTHSDNAQDRELRKRGQRIYQQEEGA